MRSIGVICMAFIMMAGLTGCHLFKSGSDKAEISKTNPAKPAGKESMAKADDAGKTKGEVKVDESLKAPEKFKVIFDTTKGKATLEVYRDWAPKGVDRFYQLAKGGFFNDTAFFRVLTGFVAQWGIHGDPAVSAEWRSKTITDDPVKNSNSRGTVSFATGGPNTRTTQLFVNFRDNANLDGMGFSPIGKFDDEGMKVMDSLYAEYGEGAPQGRGPAQHLIQQEGNSYLKEKFPEMDYIKSMTVEE